MQQVSHAWKDAHKTLLLPQSYVEVSLNVGDPESQADAQAADNGQEFYSNSAAVVQEIDKTPTRYATLESNQWLLDGTFKILPPNNFGEQGYIGDLLSDDDGYYTTTPTITVTFSRVFTELIPGITVVWATAYDEYAESFKVTAYNGDAVVAEKEVTDNAEVTSVVEMDIVDYNRITVEVLRWCLPHRRARIEELTIGIIKKFAGSGLLSFSHSMFVDALSAELPKAEIVFEVTNLNAEFNPDNPQGVAKYLMERQRVDARYGYKLNGTVEWIKAGTFFMSEWETPQNGISATFTARDALEYMTDKYTGTNAGTLKDIAQAAFEQAGLPLLGDGTVRWQLDAVLETVTPPENVELGGYTVAEVLQFCAHAACCVFYQDRQGMVHIEPLAAGVTDYVIDRFVSYANSEISLTKQLKAVDVNNGMAVVTVSDIGETQTVSNPLIGEDRAETVAQWIADFLVNRKLLSGEYRSDPRLDALDRITNINQFAETTVLVTEVSYRYTGAFRGSYGGRSGV